MNRTLIRTVFGIASLVALAIDSGTAIAAPVFYGPVPYLSAADSPFAATTFETFYLENFEDARLNTPGATASPGWRSINLAGQTDSVEGLVGVGSFFSNFTETLLTITFDAAALGGRLPTHAGIVWTDVGPDATSGGIRGQPIRFSARDAAGNSLGEIGPFVVGDNTTFSSKSEDRFFGVFHAEGIASITLDMGARNNWEVDHLQYGVSTVPLPAAGYLLMSCLIGLVVRSRRT